LARFASERQRARRRAPDGALRRQALAARRAAEFARAGGAQNLREQLSKARRGCNGSRQT
jgi:hypothetical protein